VITHFFEENEGCLNVFLYFCALKINMVSCPLAKSAATTENRHDTPEQYKQEKEK